MHPKFKKKTQSSVILAQSMTDWHWNKHRQLRQNTRPTSIARESLLNTIKEISIRTHISYNMIISIITRFPKRGSLKLDAFKFQCVTSKLIMSRQDIKIWNLCTIYKGLRYKGCNCYFLSTCNVTMCVKMSWHFGLMTCQHTISLVNKSFRIHMNYICLMTTHAYML